ncbi:MAG: hypothetical protein DMG56_14370 [Acidobacteria bacterium]|nr:MAG: hypothetical protein DMG56_14370 [Acidobacteriota bacterium]
MRRGTDRVKRFYAKTKKLARLSMCLQPFQDSPPRFSNRHHEGKAFRNSQTTNLQNLAENREHTKSLFDLPESS